MQLCQLKRKHKLKEKKRKGRGGKRGTFCGRGVKGQKARAGRKLAPQIRIFIKRYPKLRGYKFKGKEKEIFVFNLGFLNEKFQEGQEVSPKSLFEKKLISKIKNKFPKIKILAKGELTKKLIFKNCEFSKKAREKIKKCQSKIL